MSIVEREMIYELEVYEPQYLAEQPYYAIFVVTYGDQMYVSPNYATYDEALEVYKSIEHNYSIQKIALYHYRLGDEYCMIKTEKL